MDDYADVLGSRLVTAIRNGTASSDQLKTAVEKIGKAAEASAEIVKNVYGSGVGQSMDAVAEAVIMVKKNLGHLVGDL